MKKTFVIFLLLMFSTMAFAKGTIWFQGSFDEAKAKAATEDKLILIDFFSYG